MHEQEKLRKLKSQVITCGKKAQEIAEKLKLEVDLVVWEKQAKKKTMYHASKQKRKLVIDTSCMNDQNPFDVIEQYDKVVILTTVLKELDKMKKIAEAEYARVNMRRLLALNAQDKYGEKYEVVEVASSSYPDDDILEYCKEHRDSTILFTCDKVLAGRTKPYKIPYILGKPYSKVHVKDAVTIPKEWVTLDGVFPVKSKEKLGMQITNKPTKQIIVLGKENRRKEAIANIYTIEKGDYIIISKKLGKGKLSVTEYAIQNTDLKEHAEIINKYIISNEKEIQTLEHLPGFVQTSLKVQFVQVKKI